MIDFWRLFKFAIIGGIGATLNTSLLYVFTESLGLYYLVSSILAVEIAIVFQFTLNDFWTFRDRRSNSIKIFIWRLVKSNVWRTFGMAVNVSILFILTEFFGVYYIVSNFAGIFCAFLINYFLENKLTWK